MSINWTSSAEHRHTTAPISVLGHHSVARDLLLISRHCYGKIVHTLIINHSRP